MDRELMITHLYPDVMNLYGEYANIAVLRRHLQALGVDVMVNEIMFEDRADFLFDDFIYMGAGTERTQKAILSGLLEQRDYLRDAVDRGVPLLFTGNAMETLGASITDAGGKVWPALGLADFTTVETDRRDPGDVIAHSALLDRPVVGFINKCSVTHGVAAPLFDRLDLGFGNDAEKGAEGYASGNVLATHLTGPVLVKNPELTDLVIRRIFDYKGWELPQAIPVLPHEREVYEVTLAELSARVKAN